MLEDLKNSKKILRNISFQRKYIIKTKQNAFSYAMHMRQTYKKIYTVCFGFYSAPATICIWLYSGDYANECFLFDAGLWVGRVIVWSRCKIIYAVPFGSYCCSISLEMYFYKLLRYKYTSKLLLQSFLYTRNFKKKFVSGPIRTSGPQIQKAVPRRFGSQYLTWYFKNHSIAKYEILLL